ncbi:MAG: hypothetical protein ABI405_04515 [Parafilimonas sp.]
MKKKILLTANCFLLIAFITTMNACKPKCKDCVAIPTAVDADAIALQNINHLIDTTTARMWIERYLVFKDSICNNKVGIDSNILDYSESFNKQALLKLLCKPTCIGLDIAYGMDSIYKVHQIIYGVDTGFNKLYVDSLGISYAVENAQMCPNYCPNPAPPPTPGP